MLDRTRPATLLLAILVSSITAAAAAAGPEWTETDDAGRLPGDAQVPFGVGALTRINGTLDGNGFTAGGDFQDVYLVRVVDKDIFLATLAPPTDGGASDFDTQLWLFRLTGLGLLGNDDVFTGSEYSAIPMAADDGSGAVVDSNGLYYVAISGFDSDPVSLGGSIFLQATRTEVSGPDGSGGSLPVVDWSTSIGETGSYTIRLVGVEFVNCPTDIDGDGMTGFADLLILLATWGPCAGCPADVDGSGIVDFTDLLMVLSAWGPC